ncbi:MAG: type II toxin-antitoxin system HicB family antitoxin [Candidatus Woesearchaeota archaeon]
MRHTFKNHVDLSQGMTRKYTVIIERDEDGWLVSNVVGLPGCHTQGKTMDELLARTKEAIQAYVGEDEDTEILHEFVGIQHIEA